MGIMSPAPAERDTGAGESITEITLASLGGVRLTAEDARELLSELCSLLPPEEGEVAEAVDWVRERINELQRLRDGIGQAHAKLSHLAMFGGRAGQLTAEMDRLAVFLLQLVDQVDGHLVGAA